MLRVLYSLKPIEIIVIILCIVIVLGNIALYFYKKKKGYKTGDCAYCSKTYDNKIKLVNAYHKKYNEELLLNITVEGMRCGQCEAHINNEIRKKFDVSYVKANRFKNNVLIKSYKILDKEEIIKTIESLGYIVKKS